MKTGASGILAAVAVVLAQVSCAVELDGGWTLALDPGNVGKTNSWAAAARPDAKPAPVPGVIQQVYPRYCGVAWYYRTLPATKAGDGKRLILKFGAVDYFCDVYIGGRKIGSNEGAENAFSFDVTGSLEADSLLAVRVVNPGEDEIEGFTCKTIPHRNKYEKMEFNPGWCYNTGGITLPVALEAVPDVRVADVFVKADWQTGRIAMEVTFVNDSGKEQKKDVPIEVRHDDSPRPVCSAMRHHVIPTGKTTFEETLDVPGFKLWSVDVPNVYSVTVDGHATRFGFRDFRLVDGWFTLNGKRMFLKSAHTGNHMPGGLSVFDPKTPELEFRDFQNMKAMGFNCVRFIATQATPRQLDYCDKIGLMVYQETYASWSLADSSEAKRRYLDSIRCELFRDRNHPSIVIWGAINEMRQGDAVAAARDMLPEMRRIDPTRLWIYSSGRWDLWPRKPKGGKTNWPYQFDGKPGPDWSVGSASNPGSASWDCVWGEDGDVANNDAPYDGPNALRPAYGDLHFYPGYPHDADQVRKIRKWSAHAKPAFLSEYGVGSLLDVIDHCHEFERRGIRHDAPDYALMSDIRDRYIADWKELGLSRFFADPVDFLRESERMNARSRREGFDLVRSNPRFAGFNLTGALDHAICGEGPMSLFRRIKDENFDVFRDGWSDLRWCLFLSRGNYFEGDAVEFEAVLADFDALRDGEYTAAFAIADADGTKEWQSEKITLKVPQTDADGRRLVAYQVAKLRAEGKFRPGRHFLRAYLDHGGYAAAFEKHFYVTARPAVAQNSLIEIGKADEKRGQDVMKRVAEGATALVHLEEWGTKPPTFLPMKNLKSVKREHWLYHDDTLILPHALSKGTKTGFMDWDFFDGCFPCYGFTTDTKPESVASVNFNVGGPAVYSRSFNLAVFRYGKGKLIISTFPLSASSPAGATILSNAMH